ncbi:MAG: aldo/keto reductase, partial [Deltaproteobacteria bacterium]|nr:aldo/keto reductase [Deltaproteobacteria bacterium]
MIYRQLGKTPLNVSLIGYGAWALGQKGWPHVDEQEAEKTLELCIKSGINLYDTAPIYGFGRSEEILGRVLAPVRKKVVIATKCGLRWNDSGHVRHDLSRDGVHRDIEGSLKRLQTDYIDLYQIHWPDRNTPLDDTLATLMQLRSQGVIRHIGVSNFSMELLRSAADCADIISVQECYNLLQRSPETEILP